MEQMAGVTSQEEHLATILEVVSTSTRSLEEMRNRPAREDLEKETAKHIEDSINSDVQLGLMKEWKGMFASASAFNQKFEILVFDPSRLIILGSL